MRDCIAVWGGVYFSEVAELIGWLVVVVVVVMIPGVRIELLSNGIEC